MSERTILASAAKNSILDKIEFMKKYDENLEKANKENEILFREQREEKERLHDIQREFQINHIRNMMERDPYKTKINDKN